MEKISFNNGVFNVERGDELLTTRFCSHGDIKSPKHGLQARTKVLFEGVVVNLYGRWIRVLHNNSPFRIEYDVYDLKENMLDYLGGWRNVKKIKSKENEMDNEFEEVEGEFVTADGKKIKGTMKVRRDDLSKMNENQGGKRELLD